MPAFLTRFLETFGLALTVLFPDGGVTGPHRGT